MKKIQHILIVAPAFPENDQQGIVIPPLQLYLKEIRNRYPLVRISVISIHAPFFSTRYDWNGISVYPLNGKNGNLLLRPFIWLKGIFQIRKIHTLFPIDLVHSFWYNESTFLGSQLAKRFSIPHFATFMGQDAKKSNLYNRIINSKRIGKIALSQFQSEVYRTHSNQPIHAVIPFGISKYDSELEKAPSKTTLIDLICVSSLIELKRIDLFIDLVARLKVFFPSITAEIIGEGKLFVALTTKIKTLGLENNITLLGKLSRENCLARMKSAKILIHTSCYEGQGYVLNESLALGCTVITLSKSLLVKDKNYSIVNDTEELFLKSQETLSLSSLTKNPAIPIKMEDTLIAYDKLFQEFGISF